mmetsp:Transcript_4472/g.11454  ORF Transcript_4472/g.11454 Transcript_4472/m.11454 type:complete len:276 (+) Transcript_4472:122-949(+)
MSSRSLATEAATASTRSRFSATAALPVPKSSSEAECATWSTASSLRSRLTRRRAEVASSRSSSREREEATDSSASAATCASQSWLYLCSWNSRASSSLTAWLRSLSRVTSERSSASSSSVCARTSSARSVPTAAGSVRIAASSSRHWVARTCSRHTRCACRASRREPERSAATCAAMRSSSVEAAVASSRGRQPFSSIGASWPDSLTTRSSAAAESSRAVRRAARSSAQMRVRVRSTLRSSRLTSARILRAVSARAPSPKSAMWARCSRSASPAE